MPPIALHRANLDALAAAHPATLEVAREVLSAPERARAARLNHPLHRARFIAGRRWLRELLAQNLDQPAAQIRLASAPAGKPYLPDFPDLHFSLAHSGPHALLALSRSRRVGVDIELVRAHAIARAALAPRECAHNDREFLQLWTLKEAVLKAEGCGLSAAPADLDVSQWPDKLQRRDAATGQWQLCPTWQLQILQYPNCVAALAVERPEWFGCHSPDL